MSDPKPSTTKTDAKGRRYSVDARWLVVHTDVVQAVSLQHVSWWRLGADPISETVWCLDVVAGPKQLKLYFEGKEAGLRWLETWLRVSAW